VLILHLYQARGISREDCVEIITTRNVKNYLTEEIGMESLLKKDPALLTVMKA